ncbi:uncharacterized protein A4U43_C08F1610 [Asparagus officinalis]|nr:uncharacterized protein A4U43_C08F1610 [Asparagus officinalis]
MAGDERVEISIKAIGPSPPSSIRVPSLIKVSDLRSLVSLDRQLPKDRLKLILKGKILKDENEDGEDVNVRFNSGDLTIGLELGI